MGKKLFQHNIYKTSKFVFERLWFFDSFKGQLKENKKSSKTYVSDLQD
jgi:hypothetical protein